MIDCYYSYACGVGGAGINNVTHTGTTDSRIRHGWKVEDHVHAIMSSIGRKGQEQGQASGSGLVIKCGADSVVGNLLQVVQSGIGNAKSVILFVTKSYVASVEAPNFSICQYEFNVAVRVKCSEIVFVLLESDAIINPQGIVGK
jgi:hypothetical protein